MNIIDYTITMFMDHLLTGTVFNRADIARALLSKFAAEQALNSAFAAECQQANVIFFIGTTIMDQMTKDEISKHFFEYITMNNTVNEKVCIETIYS